MFQEGEPNNTNKNTNFAGDPERISTGPFTGQEEAMFQIANRIEKEHIEMIEQGEYMFNLMSEIADTSYRDQNTFHI